MRAPDKPQQLAVPDYVSHSGWPIFFLKWIRLNKREQLILLISCIAFAQTLLHLLSMNAYGFHEDELLYMTLGDHLAWGYVETGPLIAVIGNISKTLLGNSLFAMRIIPAICAGAIVHLTGMITIRLGGKSLAIIIACTAVAFSPAFLASGALFIPQVFDELFWLLTVYLIVCWIQKPNDNYLYGLGLVIGFGILLKYTLILYVAGLLIGILCTPHLRFLFIKKAFYFAVLIAILVLLPHLIWQFDHRLPALAHYHELKKMQLNYLHRTDFFVQQLLVNGPSLIVWVVGMIYLFLSKKLNSYRFFGIAFLTSMVVLALFKGKPYYGFGAFPPLFVVGGVCLEQWLVVRKTSMKFIFISFLILPNLLLSVISLPILRIENAAKVFAWAQDHLGITFTVRWEDQKLHRINQNYADMIGWDELARKTASLYMALPAAEKERTIIYTDSYGIASAMSYYAKYYSLPKVVSLNGSFASWAPKHLDGKHIISFLKHKAGETVDLTLVESTKVITNPFSRLYGMHIKIYKNTNDFATEFKQALVIKRLN